MTIKTIHTPLNECKHYNYLESVNDFLFAHADDISEEDIETAKKNAEKLQLEEKIPTGRWEGDYNIRKTHLVAVHGTNYFPEDGKIKAKTTIRLPKGKERTKAVEEAEKTRRTVHFSLNHVYNIGGFYHPGAGTRKYIVTAPLQDLVELNDAIGGSTVDFFFVGDVKLPETTKIFMNSEETEKYIIKISELRGCGQWNWDSGRGTTGYINQQFNSKGWFAGAHCGHWSSVLEEEIMKQLYESNFKHVDIEKTVSGLANKYDERYIPKNDIERFGFSYNHSEKL